MNNSKFCGSVLAAITAAACMAPRTAHAQSSAPPPGGESAKDAKPAKSAPRTAWGKPDFTGFFDLQYTPNMAFGKEESVPYTAAGRAAYQNHDAKDDPTSNCWFPGVPRIMQSPYPTQWVQTPTHIAILFEYMHMFRSIPLDGRAHAAGMEPPSWAIR